MTSKDLGILTQTAFQTKGDMTVIQNFIKCSGPKPYICRTCWKKDGSHHTWIIT